VCSAECWGIQLILTIRYFNSFGVFGTPCTKREHTILRTECGEMTDGCWWQNVNIILSSPTALDRTCGVVCNSRGNCNYIGKIFSTPIGLHFVRFLFWDIQRYIIQWSTCRHISICLRKYHNSITNLFSLAFQQLKPIV
jgi:hypothetical protein